MACALGIEQDCNECRMCGKDRKKRTNADRIRNMTNEEYAKAITEMGCSKCENITGKCLEEDGENGCVNFVKEWLESECDAE